ncbi:unnamed protein product [Gongylonema pulchrum]|uniref:ChSh domain-containing protein n=1 Tax=Gongylonema pulchrum TaxID=637853 RepID=A0A183E5W5_9BILA|nr:unnamed protein product [Gongylonema pulchrum]
MEENVDEQLNNESPKQDDQEMEELNGEVQAESFNQKSDSSAAVSSGSESSRNQSDAEDVDWSVEASHKRPLTRARAKKIRKKRSKSGNDTSDDSDEATKEKRARVERIRGVKRGVNGEILALVCFDNGRNDLISTRILVKKCPEKLVDFYEKSLKFVPPSCKEDNPPE